jgi:predicted PurR-regulated permease PerM
MNGRAPADLVRTTFQLLVLGALIAASFWVVRPFLAPLTWAIAITVATWPVLLRIQSWLGGRRSLAVATMTIGLLLILVVPLYFSVRAIAGGAERIAGATGELATLAIPQPPDWVQSIPLVGAKFAGRWRQFAAAGPEEVSAQLAPYVRGVVLWFAGQVGSIGLLLVQFLLTVVISAILYANGETAARGAVLFVRRLAGPEGENAVRLAGQAIRGVALGVVVTAVLQTSFAGLGLVIVGVPFATILTAAIFILCIAQIGPAILLIPTVFWVYSANGPAWGTGFLVWAVFCSTFDNFLRPLLIKRGADLPLLLIFTGVIGGLIGFGVIGLFIGPVVLAVAYTLLADWVSEKRREAEV